MLQALKSGAVKGKAAREVGRFAEIILQGRKERDLRGLASLVQWMLQESGLTQTLEKENTIESESRLRNLEEFLNAAADEETLGSTLEQFLDRITLVSDADSVDVASRLSLMTIHCAKGLEFSAVFLSGMEEDVFPNRNAKDDENGLEEERRLFYVAITRAQMKLYLTGARHRRVMGMNTLGLPSRFLRSFRKMSSIIRFAGEWKSINLEKGTGRIPMTNGPKQHRSRPHDRDPVLNRREVSMPRPPKKSDPQNPKCLRRAGLSVRVSPVLASVTG